MITEFVVNQVPTAEVNDLAPEFGFEVSYPIGFLRTADAHKIKIPEPVPDGKIDSGPRCQNTGVKVFQLVMPAADIPFMNRIPA